MPQMRPSTERTVRWTPGTHPFGTFGPGSRTRWAFLFGLVGLIFLSGCISSLQPEQTPPGEENVQPVADVPHEGGEEGPNETGKSPSVEVGFTTTPERAYQGQAVSIAWEVQSNASDSYARHNQTIQETRIHWGHEPVPKSALSGDMPYGDASDPQGPTRAPASFEADIIPLEKRAIYLRAETLVHNETATIEHWTPERKIDVQTGPTHTIPLLHSWPTTDLDIVILPPATGPVYNQELEPFPEGTHLLTESPYVQATQDAIQAWENAISLHAEQAPNATHLSEFSFDTRVVGDNATLEDLESADILVAYASSLGPVAGFAWNSGWYHQERQTQHCTIVNSQMARYGFTSDDMYNIHVHEFGHCLGLDHPEEPQRDVMASGYGTTPGDPDTERRCISTLNLQGIEAAYAWIPQEEWTPPPEEAQLAQAMFEVYPPTGQEGCPNGQVNT